MDIQLFEQLCSRLCHDLVSPVGAIHNGVELIEEMDGDAAIPFLGEAVTLIAHSAGQAERRLRLFRLAYGAGGREARGFAEMRAAAGGWTEGGRSRLLWPADTPPDAAAARTGLAKTLLGTVVLADEALSHGGAVAVAGTGGADGGFVTVTAEGRPGALRPETAAALAGTLGSDGVTPRTVLAWMTGRQAEAYGLRLTAAPAGPERLVLRIDW